MADNPTAIELKASTLVGLVHSRAPTTGTNSATVNTL